MWLISDKTSLKDSGLFEGFCDHHCHLLPGVDDGVQEDEESFYILRQWESLGVEEVWLTPHIMGDIPNGTEDLKRRFETFQLAYAGQIELHLAAENMLDNLFLQRLEARDLLTLGITGKHLLVETSYFNPPMDMKGIISKIQEAGYIPVLAHPERYQYMDIGHYINLKTSGVLFQLNIPSLVGAYGIEAQKKAEMLLEKRMYDCCGTDIHSARFMDYMLNSKVSKKTVKAIRKVSEILI